MKMVVKMFLFIMERCRQRRKSDDLRRVCRRRRGVRVRRHVRRSRDQIPVCQDPILPTAPKANHRSWVRFHLVYLKCLLDEGAPLSAVDFIKKPNLSF